MVKMIEHQEAIKHWKETLKEFHQLWLEMGEPHPSSNKYLNLNRMFFYAKGMEAGVKMEQDNHDD